MRRCLLIVSILRSFLEAEEDEFWVGSENGGRGRRLPWVCRAPGCCLKVLCWLCSLQDILSPGLECRKKTLCFVAYIFRGELFKLFRIQLIHLLFHVCQLTFRRLLLCFALHKEGAFPSGFFFFNSV